jgi:NAD(P) transhydrogenase subunit beta
MTLTAGINLAYLIAAVLFIVGLSRLSSPATARSGNLVASVGMLIAILATLLDRKIVTFWTIALGVLVGTVIGAVSARMVKMTAMPQMVALFNGVGGGGRRVVGAGGVGPPRWWRRRSFAGWGCSGRFPLTRPCPSS